MYFGTANRFSEGLCKDNEHFYGITCGHNIVEFDEFGLFAVYYSYLLKFLWTQMINQMLQMQYGLKRENMIGSQKK